MSPEIKVQDAVYEYVEPQRTLRWRLAPLWSLVSPMLAVTFITLSNAALGDSIQIQFQYALVSLVIVVGMQMFVGTSGVLSFGHIAFAAVGAWTVGLLTVPSELKRNLLPDLFPWLFDLSAPWPVAVALGGIIGGILALASGSVLMRLNGLQAGIATFALLGVVNQVLTYWASIGPRSGQSMVGIPKVLDLYTTLLFALGTIVFAWFIQRTRSAQLLRAAREDGIAAPAVGINQTKQRLIIFTISGVVAGVGGGLFALTNRVLQASQLNVDMTFLTLAMLVFGGMLSLNGAVVGSLIFSLIDVLLQRLQSGITIDVYIVTIPQGTRPLVLGFLLVLMLLLRPNGITGGREFVFPFRTEKQLPGVPPTNE